MIARDAIALQGKSALKKPRLVENARRKVVQQQQQARRQHNSLQRTLLKLANTVRRGVLGHWSYRKLRGSASLMLHRESIVNSLFSSALLKIGLFTHFPEWIRCATEQKLQNPQKLAPSVSICSLFARHRSAVLQVDLVETFGLLIKIQSLNCAHVLVITTACHTSQLQRRRAET